MAVSGFFPPEMSAMQPWWKFAPRVDPGRVESPPHLERREVIIALPAGGMPLRPVAIRKPGKLLVSPG